MAAFPIEAAEFSGVLLVFVRQLGGRRLRSVLDATGVIVSHRKDQRSIAVRIL